MLNGKRYGHRKQHSLSAINPPNSGANIQWSHNDGKGEQIRGQRRRYSHSHSQPPSNSGSDDDTRRDMAWAEAEAKLVGSSSFARAEQRSLHKRTSLQQLAPLSEEPNQHRLTSSRSSSALSKRTQFNKPLDLAMPPLPQEDYNSKRRSHGHSRRSSRNVDMDWRTSIPSLPAAQPPTSPRHLFQFVPFTPTRVNFARDDANPHQRRPLFIAHLPFSALTSLFRSRQIVHGMLRVNKRNRSDAYVFCEELDADIYIAGSRNRNRALEGDVVAVRLVDVDKILLEKHEKEQVKMVRNAGQQRVRLPDEEDENEIIFGGDESVDLVKPKYCGVVVAIMERAQNQVFSGTLTMIRPNNKRAQEEKEKEEQYGTPTHKDVPRIVWFKATDKRVPLIAIPVEQTPSDFVDNSEKYATRLFVGSIKRWPITSLHPFGTLEKELGSVHDLGTQTKAIYADNNVTDADFSQAVYDCLPPAPFEASVDDPSPTTKRRDFTGVRCFTIDPKDSNVLDDALSIEQLEEDVFQVGVHISDVTYFIKPHSALDKEARTRGVRVDLLHSHVPMVPESLTEQITNLIPNHTRFTVSVVWKINRHGKVLDTWFGKSVIRSCAQLTLDDVQAVLDGQSIETLDANVEKDIQLLNAVALELYNGRMETGCLTQCRDELVFDFDTDFTPHNVAPHKKLDLSHRIVKEFLLLANISVAQKISSRLPEQALLRRHASPVDRKIRQLQQYCSRQLGVQVDIGSAGALERSIQAIEDVKLRKLVSVIVLRTMSAPKYICAGTYDIAKYSHYALNVPLFTHFTAPSRRFVDLLVHRQLEYALSSEENTFYLDRNTVQKLAQHCNVKKQTAIHAREQSSLLFLGTYLDNSAKQNGKAVVYREATVVAVDENHFDVMVADLNMEKRVHLANLPVWRSDYGEQKHTLTMYWRKGVESSTGKQRHWSLSDDEDDHDDDAYLDEELLLEEMKRASLGDDDEKDPGHSLASPARDLPVSPVHRLPQPQQKDGLERRVEALAIAPPTVETHLEPAVPETTKSSTKRASLVRARLSDSTAYSTEQGYQTIKALDKIRVALVIDTLRTPPLIRIVAVNPFA
ncbi:RNB-domain-containing protein [Hesseltinella vesiculosa]|uniref:RNB-domain-containing protein n=1 Tax=Hesseltinella vesiculosa TaxID=101127 RepID=A0A1X2GPA0_9FUNG|nr:RNB-domain-containing protein [Hesseltinella vesiculosa]